MEIGEACTTSYYKLCLSPRSRKTYAKLLLLQFVVIRKVCLMLIPLLVGEIDAMLNRYRTSLNYS